MNFGDEIRFQIYQIMTNDIVKLILDIHYYFNKTWLFELTLLF